MIATSATDKRIIVWHMRVLDLFSEQPDIMFDEPQVQIMFSVGPPQQLQQQMIITQQ